MSAQRQYLISCDRGGCYDWQIVKLPTLAAARKNLRRDHHWQTRTAPMIGGGQMTLDYCPRHRQ